MKIETILTPAELPALAQRDLRATACVVFDVLRATSTFVTALHHGAQAIIPVSEIAEALAFKKMESGKRKAETIAVSNNIDTGRTRHSVRAGFGQTDDGAHGVARPTHIQPADAVMICHILLGGERNGVRISAEGVDFDLGNSPREYAPEKVSGKTIVSTTTNGTRALRACANAQTVLAGSFLNLAATAEFILQQNCASLLLVCAGTGENTALEDVLAAGAMIELLTARGDARLTISDSTEIARRAWLEAKPDLSAAVANAENARRLLANPEFSDDVAFCLQRDIFPLVAQMGADGRIRRA